MRFTPFELPEQNVPDSKKTKDWHIKHGQNMMYYITNSDYEDRLGEIRKCEEDYMATPVKRPQVTNPYLTTNENNKLVDNALGVDYETYPLIEGVIDDILGKYLSRRLERKVYSINRDAINSKLDEKVDYIVEELMREQSEILKKEAGVDVNTPQPELELPDDIEEFFTKNYKTLAEEVSDDIIEQFLEVNRNKEKIKKILTEYLYGDTCAGIIEEKDGHPHLQAVRYDECYYDIDPDSEVQRDMEVFAYYKFFTENEIYNKFSLSRTEKKKVKEAFAKMNSGTILSDELILDNAFSGQYQNCASGVSYNGWSETIGRRHRLRVLLMKWKSRRDIRSLSYTDKKTQKVNYKLLPDNYKERNRDNIDITSIETIHQVQMLGPEIILSFGEIEHRHSKIDNPAKANIPSIGLVGKTFIKSSELRSVAKKLKGLQLYASDILFQMKFMINSTDGKVLLYDSAQTPKQFLDKYGAEGAINRVLHHVKKDKLMVFNSADKKDRHAFNQFTTMDLSNRGLQKDLIDGLMLVEDLARKFVGLTKEAQEGGEKYQTATSVNRSIIASNSRIEVYFEPFDNFIGEVFNKVLSTAKVIYKPGQVFQQVFGDLQTKFFTIHKDIHNNDLGVFIGDSAKNLRDKEIIDRGAEMSLSNAQDPELILDLINVLEKDSATESKAILERTVAAIKKLQADQNKLIQEAEDKKLQAEADKQKRADELVREGHKKDIKVAHIYADNKTDNEDKQRTSDELKKGAELQNKLELENMKNDKPKESSSENKSSDSKPKASTKSDDKNKSK